MAFILKTSLAFWILDVEPNLTIAAPAGTLPTGQDTAKESYDALGHAWPAATHAPPAAPSVQEVTDHGVTIFSLPICGSDSQSHYG